MNRKQQHTYLAIDEVFIDVTPYLASYKLTAHQLAMRMSMTEKEVAPLAPETDFQ